MQRTTDLYRLAEAQGRVITRQQAEEHGYSYKQVKAKLASGEWPGIVKGAYLVGPGPVTWWQRQRAACLATGEGAASSHLAAWRIFGLEGVTSSMVEITVPYGKGSRLDDVVVHRTRRWWHDGEVTTVDGIPVVCVERVLAETGRYVAERTIEVGMECAIRKRLTSATRLRGYLDGGGLLIPGAKVLDKVLRLRPAGGPAGSPAEVDILRAMRADGLKMPMRQRRIVLSNGLVIVGDFVWPDEMVVMEWNGEDAHGSPKAKVADFDRMDALDADGWAGLQYGGTVLVKRPRQIVAAIRRLLEERAGQAVRVTGT